MEKSPLTIQELKERLSTFSPKSEDALTRIYLRLLDNPSWSYKLHKETLLQEGKSQEIYRKRLNQFARYGFLQKEKPFTSSGKQVIPFRSNKQILDSYLHRYAFCEYEYYTALQLIADLNKREERKRALKQKIQSKELLTFDTSIFSLYFMGDEVAKFFFQLLVISVVGQPLDVRRDSNSVLMYNLLLNILSNLKLDVAYNGVDFLGKRLFTDQYVKKAISLLYSLNYQERHAELMQIAIIEDLFELIINPKVYDILPREETPPFIELDYSERYDHIIAYIKARKNDHFLPYYFGQRWEHKLSVHLSFALRTALEEPSPEMKHFIKHLSSKYHVTSQHLQTVSSSFKRKLNNPVRIWQMKTLF